ncbi:Dystrobrevin beta, partial [Armadillidium vulgare]
MSMRNSSVKNVNLIDIWNIIEAFRENGLNTLDPHTGVKVSRLETLISTLYHSLNKRLPTEQHINIQASTSTLLNWLLAAYDNDLWDSFEFSVSRWHSQLSISDSNGHLSLDRFSEYLHEALSLPAAVYESPSFHYTPDLAHQIFDGVTKINVNDFLDVVLGEPGPECLAWLPLLHRLASSESVIGHKKKKEKNKNSYPDYKLLLPLDPSWLKDFVGGDFISE